MFTLMVLAALHTLSGQNTEPPAPKTLIPMRVDAVVVPEGSYVMVESKIRDITDFFVSDEEVIHLDATRGNGRIAYFAAKKSGVCRITMKNKDRKVDTLVVVLQKKANEKGAKK
jgi:hypothetical protein